MGVRGVEPVVAVVPVFPAGSYRRRTGPTSAYSLWCMFAPSIREKLIWGIFVRGAAWIMWMDKWGPEEA